VITRTWYDPCPACGQQVTAFDLEPEYVIDNPTAVMSFPNPACPHEDDPDADCICTVLLNPAPDPWRDEYIAIGVTVTMHPCGDVIRAPLGPRGEGSEGSRPLGGLLAGWTIHQQTTPEPGTLGELMADWAADSPRRPEGGPER
jgi:hypothetical protein